MSAKTKKRKRRWRWDGADLLTGAMIGGPGGIVAWHVRGWNALAWRAGFEFKRLYKNKDRAIAAVERSLEKP